MSSVSARAFSNTLFYSASLFTFLMKLFSTIYNCHEQSTDSTRPGRDWPCLDDWHRHRHWHWHRWRCVCLNAPRGEFCAQQIYVYELYDMYAALTYRCICQLVPQASNQFYLLRPGQNFAASLSPAAGPTLGFGFYFVCCTRSHLQLVAPTTLVLLSS